MAVRLLFASLLLLLTTTAEPQDLGVSPPIRVVAGTPDAAIVDVNWASGSAAGCTLTGCLSVTRALAETCISAGGVITYATSNTPCVTSSGLHVTGGGQNVVTNSQTLSGASALNVTFTPSNTTAPDGTANGAGTLVDNVTNGNHRLTVVGGLTPTIGQLVTFSIFAQTGTCVGASFACHFVQLLTAAHDDSNTTNATINYVLDSLGGAQPCLPIAPNAIGNANPVVDAGGQSIFLSGGAFWGCRVWMTIRASSTTSATIGVYMTSSTLLARSAAYVGTGSSIILWGAQVNAGGIIPYIPTAGSAATLPADNIVATGLLKTTLEGSAGRVVLTTNNLHQQQAATGTFLPATVLGVGVTTLGVGRVSGNVAKTAWGAGTLSTVNQVERNSPPVTNTQVNNFGLSWNGSGRYLVLNNGTAVTDSNTPSAVSSEQIGALSDGTQACECDVQRIRAWSTRSDVAVASATAVTGIPAPLPAYTGAVATRTSIPVQVSTTFRQLMARSRHRIMENVSCITLKYANYSIAASGGTLGQEVGPGAANTITASVEYPAGTFTQVTFSSSTSGTIPNGGTLTSDSVCPSGGIVAGDYIFAREYITSTTGVVYNDMTGIDDVQNGEAMTIAASGITDQTMSGTVTNTGAQNYYPVAIIGTTVRRTGCIIGDSINLGARQNTNLDAEGLFGIATSVVGRSFGMINMAVGGDQVALFPSNHAQRLPLAAYCTTVFSDYGVNDAVIALSSAATLQANLQTTWALFSGKTITQTTITPDTTSTDSWATLGNQTQVTGSATIATVNTWLRGLPSGLNNVFDVQPQVSTGVNSGFWQVNGVANWCTGTIGAGLHPNQGCTAVVRASGVVDLTKMN